MHSYISLATNFSKIIYKFHILDKFYITSITHTKIIFFIIHKTTQGPSNTTNTTEFDSLLFDTSFTSPINTEHGNQHDNCYCTTYSKSYIRTRFICSKTFSNIHQLGKIFLNQNPRSWEILYVNIIIQQVKLGHNG